MTFAAPQQYKLAQEDVVRALKKAGIIDQNFSSQPIFSLDVDWEGEVPLLVLTDHRAPLSN